MATEVKNDFLEKNEQVLYGISQLQQREKELYNNLEGQNLTEQERKNIIQKINELSQMRMDMYSNLQNMYSLYQTNANNLSDSINIRRTSVDMMENELNQLKTHLNEIDQMKLNKLRTVEINNYYAKRYNAYKNIMFIISITCIPIILLTMLNNNQVIPSNIYGLLISFIVVIGSYFIFTQYLDISNRDSINWDSYSWYFKKSSAPEPDTSESTENIPDYDEEEPKPLCVGSSCCQTGTTYDESLNVCVPN